MDEKKAIQVAENRAQLIDPGTLLSDSWKVFLLKWKSLVLLSLLPYFSLVPFALVALLFVGGGVVFWTGHNYVGLVLLAFIGIILALIYFSIAFSIGGIAMVYVILERGRNVTIMESLKKGWSLLWQYWIVGFLMGFIVMGGIMLFFIPGIIFMIWFMFAAYIFVSEGTRGMAALMRSREYVRGYWLGVFGRYLLIVLLTYIAIGLVYGVTMLLKQHVIGQILQYIISFVMTPLTTIYFILMYESLKKIKPNMAATSSKGSWVYITIGTFGFVLVVVLFSFLTYFAITTFMNLQQNPGYRTNRKLQKTSPADYTLRLPGASTL